MSAFFPIPSLHKAGHPIIAGAAVGMLALWWLTPLLGLIGLLGLLFCLYFFRDPDRVVPVGEGVMVAPADGRVLSVDSVTPPEELGLGDAPRVRVTIFLSVFDVHVNRVAAAGTVRKKIYHAGKFLHAAADKASLDNERSALVIDLPEAGKDYAQVQIAGLVARRIICEAREGQSFETGVRYGIIRFGSRADVYLPVGVTAQVVPGQVMLGGETIIADWKLGLPQRAGVTR